MIVIDANVIVSAVAGTHVRRVLRVGVERGLRFAVPSPQVEEAAHVLIDKLGMSVKDARALLEDLMKECCRKQPSRRPKTQHAGDFMSGHSPTGPFWPRRWHSMRACGPPTGIFSASAFLSGQRETSGTRSPERWRGR